MTVRELIKALEIFSPEMTVVVGNKDIPHIPQGTLLRDIRSQVTERTKICKGKYCTDDETDEPVFVCRIG